MCIYCNGPGSNHKACIEAWSLDYDPKSEEDAKEWLKKRRERIERELEQARNKDNQRYRALTGLPPPGPEESERAREKEFYEG